MNAKKILALLLAVVLVASVFTGCKPKAETFVGDFTYTDSVSTMSANWNPHTYQTADESYPIEFLTAGLYSFYFNDELNPVEGKDPYEGYIILPEMAASLPKDVTEKIKAEHPEFGIPESATAGFAYTIDLNKDAKWEDGTPINADDYVESMKRLLDPKLINYRAAGYYEGSFSIVGAEAYANSGRTVKRVNSGDGETMNYAFADLVKGDDGVYATPEGYKAFFGLDTKYKWMGGNNALSAYYGAGYIPDANCWDVLSAAADDEGYVPVTDETIAALYLFTGSDVWGNESKDDLGYYVSYDYTYATVEYDGTVGLYKTGDYQITLVLNKSLAGFTLLYNLTSNWLVKTDLYDACLKETTSATGSVWTSTYNTSVETTSSYGPYKMSSYQTDKSMHFVKNENWYGYSDGKHIYKDPVDGKVYPMYQTTEIDCQLVGEVETAKMMFLKGQLMGYGLQTEDLETYRNSEYCHFTPGQAVFFLMINGNMEAIKEREAAADFDQKTKDLETLTLTSFHRALGLSYDKALYCDEQDPAGKAAFGLIGNAYICDPDAGTRYRDTDQAKKVLCEVYGVDPTKFENLDDAVDSITGYDPVAAKEWFKKAFEEALEAGFVTDTNNDGICDQTIELTYSNGSSDTISDRLKERLKYLTEKGNLAAEGTPFEGKILFTPGAPVGNAWSDNLKAGLADTALCGWNGSAMDPYGLIEVYTDPSYQYDAAWFDASSVDMTLTLPVDGADKEITMDLQEWTKVLNGTVVTVDGVDYNFGEGMADADTRLTILAGIEKEVLLCYNNMPFTEDGSLALLTKKAFYVVEDYNPVMGRGGIAYLRYNYNDADWDAYVAEQGGELTY